MSTHDRKLELERKKAKLAALRKQKTDREVAKPDHVSNGTATLGADATAVPLNHTNNVHARFDTDELLKNLGITLPELTPNASGDQIHQSKSTSDLLSQPRTASPRRRPKLEVSKMNEMNLPPPDCILYSKQTQTIEAPIPTPFPSAKFATGSSVFNPTTENSPRELVSSPRFVAALEWDDEFSMTAAFDDTLGDPLDQTSGGDRMPHVTQVTTAVTPADLKGDRPKPRTLTDEERTSLLESDRFCKFFDQAARLLERALDEPADIFVDYTGAERDDVNTTQRHQLLRYGRDFFDDRWSRRRCLSALDWSPMFPELLLGAYTSNEDAPHEPDGVCLIWNLKFSKTTPEYIFHCQSPVTSASMATYHPNLVVGGTYAGQIVLWDNRCSKRTPVQRTVLSATAHTHPVHEVLIVGTQNAHNVISVSSDGKLCSWSLDMLSQPQQTMELTYRQTRTVAATSMSFFRQDVNNFLVGSEDGRIYAGSRHGNQAGVTDMLEGHQAPVTSVSAFHAEGPVDFSSLFLTTAFDWTVKLWSMKDQRPIHSFDEASDIVLDADWSPIHPAMFATADCAGRLELWNLNVDTEVPAARAQVEGQTALNKCRFHSSGLHVAAGDRSGRIHVYDLNESMATPRGDEWAMFAHTVEELRQLASERSERETNSTTTPTLGSHGTSPAVVLSH